MKLSEQAGPAVFMRGRAQLQYLRDWVLPYLERTRPGELRFWCVDGGAGTDTYTLAMLISDYFGADKPARRVRIAATESSGRALTEAGRGIYPNESLRLLPPEWVGRYFRPVSPYASTVAETIRANVGIAFLPLNPEEPPEREPFDVILCRHMPSDLGERDRLYRLFHAATAEGGYLFVDPGDEAGPPESLFRCELSAIYRKA